jgi:ribosomal protein L16 Arg81 hydroxylase
LLRGLTILVRRFDLEHSASGLFAQSLAALIGAPVFGTLFITPGPENAFPAHYDAANVFALQLAGAKRWDLFEQVFPLPLSDTDVNSLPMRPPRVMESHDLTTGDLLYVPRGLVHEVIPTSCPSLHISFGMLARSPAIPPDEGHR